MRVRTTRREAGIVKRERVCEVCGLTRNTEERIVQGSSRQLLKNLQGVN
jgi:transcriptional regulator with XRE-family HTH domain